MIGKKKINELAADKSERRKDFKRSDKKFVVEVNEATNVRIIRAAAVVKVAT